MMEDFKGENSEELGLTISVPLDKVNVSKLTKLLTANEATIKSELGIDSLPVDVEDDEVLFPWFSGLPEAEDIAVCMQIISDLCKESRE